MIFIVYTELNDAQETALIEIMTASCKQAAFGHGPTGRLVRKVLFYYNTLLFAIV